MLKKIAIIACLGDLPLLFAKRFTELDYEVHVVKILYYCDCNYNEYINTSLKIGEVGKLFDYLNKNNIKEIVFAGKVDRPELKSISVDSVGSRLLYRILKNKILGDDKVLTTVVDFFEENNFRVLSLSDFMENKDKTKILTVKKPTEDEMQDIKTGMNLIEKISEFDVGQSVIIEDGYVLGIEAAEGTDELIRRCSKLRRSREKSGILVKTTKQNQSLKIDLPTVGINTIENLQKNNFIGLAISKEVIVMNEESVIKSANDAGIFIFIVTCVELGA